MSRTRHGSSLTGQSSKRNSSPIDYSTHKSKREIWRNRKGTDVQSRDKFTFYIFFFLKISRASRLIKTPGRGAPIIVGSSGLSISHSVQATRLKVWIPNLPNISLLTLPIYLCTYACFDVLISRQRWSCMGVHTTGKRGNRVVGIWREEKDGNTQQNSPY